MWMREDIRTYRVGSDAINRVNAWLRGSVIPTLRDARTAAHMQAQHLQDAVLLNYDRRTVFDAAANVLMPFSFFRFHYGAESIRRVLDRPAMLAWYLKLREAQDSVQNDPAYPKRLQGKFQFPMPFLPPWMGSSMFFDPLEQVAPVQSVFGLNAIQKSNEVTDDDVFQNLRAMVKQGLITDSQAKNATANGDADPLWRETKKRLQELTGPESSYSELFRPHLPIDIAWKMLTGNADEIGVLFPTTRHVRALTGINIEQPLKAGLRSLPGGAKVPDWDAWEQYRIDRELANMVGDGSANPRDALIAMIEGKGPLYDQAVSRVQGAQTAQTVTSLMGGMVFPEGERKYYQSKVERDQLLDQAVAALGQDPAPLTSSEKWAIVRGRNSLDFLRAGKATHPDERDAQSEYDVMMEAVRTGKNIPQAIAVAQSHLDAHQNALRQPNTIYDPYPGEPQKNQQAVNGFTQVIADLELRQVYDLNPVLRTRASVMDLPETRLKTFLTSELWDTYTQLSALDKRLMGDQLGEAFQEEFRNKDTRDYAQVSLEELATWVQQVRGYMPQQEIVKPGDAPEVQYATPDQSARYGAFKERTEALFNMDEIGLKLDTYHTLSPEQKRAFRAVYKDVDAYLKYYGDFMRANPDISQIMNPDFQRQAFNLDSTYTTNSLTRSVAAGLNRMAQQIGSRRTRGGGGGGGFNRTLPPSALSTRMRQALKLRKSNPRYRIPNAIFAELLGLYRRYRNGARTFNEWLAIAMQYA
jgi:hypothetical protein